MNEGNQLKRLIIPSAKTIASSRPDNRSHKSIAADSRGNDGLKVNWENYNYEFVEGKRLRLRKYERILQQKFRDEQRKDHLSWKVRLFRSGLLKDRFNF